MPTAPTLPANDAHSKRERRKEARPGELLQAALELFVEKGYAATRAEEVATRAGVSKGTLFLYFSSKEDLFKAVIQSNLSRHLMAWNQEFEGFEGSSADMLASYGSKSADEKGNNNFRGVKSRAVDALIEAIGRAETMAELRTAARALDRVVTWGFFQIPDLYLNVENVSYWNRFGLPKVQARYFAADSYPSANSAPWPLWTWWVEREQRP